MKQGRYIMNASPICGTNGLGTCVGLAVYHGKWFIAHIDCEAIVKSKTDPMYEKVMNYVTRRLHTLLGPCGSPSVHIIGGLSDFSAWAIKDGIVMWVQDTAEINYDEWDGFEILETGKFQRLKHEANNIEGDGDFTVPENPA